MKKNPPSKVKKSYNSIENIAISTLIFISIPVLMFIWFFNSQEVSSDISLWGNFGDFFGGILNPIISFASLILLGVLTVNVAKQGTEAQELLNFKLKRMEAYDSLAKGFGSLESFVFGAHRSMKFIMSSLNIMENHDAMIDKYKQESLVISRLRYSVTDFYVLIQKFNIRYGHIFEYDFQTDQFDNLVSMIGKIEDASANLDIGFKSLGYNVENNSKVITQMRVDLNIVEEGFKKFSEPLADLINKLKEEVSLVN